MQNNNNAQILYIDASTPIETSSFSQSSTAIRPHQQVCLNFMLYQCIPNTPYQLQLSIIDDTTKQTQQIGYTAPHYVNNPQNTITFNLSFIIDYFFNKIQQLKIDIARGNATAYVLTPLSSVLTSPNSTIILPLNKNNPQQETVSISATELNFTNKVIELTMSISGSPKNAFYVLKRIKYNASTNTQELIAVYKSETSSNGGFAPMIINSSYIDQGDHSKTVCFDLYINNILVASQHTTMFALLQYEMYNLTLGSYSAYIKAKETERQRQSFVQILQNKLNINLSIGIDFTGSNGDYRDNGSLHYLDQMKMNLYESAIYECGKILANYDSDQVYPVYGFGAVIPGVDKQTNHCFPLTLSQDEDANIHGLQNILTTYRMNLPKLQFAGPTYFEPLLSTIFTLVASTDVPGFNQYNIVLILTDGTINDMQQTIDLLVASSSLPVSLIIIGIGNDDFTQMEQLDSDGRSLISSNGQCSYRDIVQFVEFNKFGNDPHKLTQKVLEELPYQMEQYFYMKHNNLFI